MAEVTIAIESPLQDDVRTLIAELNAFLLSITPAEFCSHMTVEQMAGPETTVFVARDDGRAVACGALRRDAGGVGEVKRMYTAPSSQGQGIGGRILAEIESLAREEGFTRLVLETGSRTRAGVARLRARRLHALRAGARLPGHRLVGVLREGAVARLIVLARLRSAARGENSGLHGCEG